MLGVQFQTQLKCEESDETIEETSSAFALKCNITLEVNHLSQGLTQGLLDDREKTSAQLGRTALFKVNLKNLKISLAKYPCKMLRILMDSAQHTNALTRCNSEDLTQIGIKIIAQCKLGILAVVGLCKDLIRFKL